MRLLRIDNKKVDIDDATAIGIDIQTYDVKNPSVRKINITNNFTIPKTVKNLALFGNANNPQSLSLDVYTQFNCNYWVDNEQIINDARVRVEEISERITLFVYQKDDVWDLIKKVKWPDFVKDFIKWMQENNGLPSKTYPFTGSFSDLLEPYTLATSGIKLPFYFGNLYNYDPDGGEQFLEDPNSIYLRWWPTDGEKSDGGHFCVYAKTIFQYIEQKYNVNFLTNGGVVVGNLWDDEIAKGLYVPMRDLSVRYKYTGGAVSGYYFEFNNDTNFLPLKKQKDKADKTLHDFVNSFFQQLNVIKDEIIVNDEQVMKLSRFDDIETKAEVIDFGDIKDNFKFIPKIEGYAQENYIRFKEIYPEGNKDLNSKILTSLNKNIDATTELFTIDAYVNSFLNIGGGVVPDLSPKEAFKTFSFFIDGGLTDDLINIYNSEGGNEKSAAFRLQKAALYNLSGEYNFLDKIITYTKFYIVEKWLTLNDVKNIEFFKQYFIKKLNGSFFINKIVGFNPQKSNSPTQIELIKISDRVPLSGEDLNYWVDGIGDAWTDGTGDYWF